MAEKRFDPVDVAVVGGGIVGCSTAWHLARSGLRVAVFERAGIASEQSGRAWGFIRQQGRNEAELPLAIEASRLWSELTQRYGPESTQFTRSGILVPAESDADEERVEVGHRTARSFGLETQILDGDAVRRLVPELHGDWRSGLFTAEDAHGDPPASTRTVATAAREAGAVIYENTPVLAVESEGGRTSGVLTMAGWCPAAVVVIAGGVGAAALARTIGLNLPVQVITSSVGLTRPVVPFTRIAVWGPKVAYRPRTDGSFVLGNGYRGVGADYNVTPESLRNLRHFLPAFRRNWRLLRLRLSGDFVSQAKASLSASAAARPLPEPTVNEAKVRRNLDAFRTLFPDVASFELDKMWAGRIDLTPDVIPLIDQPVPDRKLFVAAGFSGHGFALGPSVGKQLAEWVVDGRPSIDLRAFRLSRFADGEVRYEKQAL